MSTYSFLQDDVTQACENDSEEFATYFPKMVNRAEERLARDLDDYGLVTETSIAVSSGNANIALPTGTRIIKNLNIEADGTRINLLPRTDEYLNAYWPVSASTATPVYYSRITDTSVRVAPTPVSTFSGRLVYTSRPTTLTSASNTNYFTKICYDALFNATMVEALVFMKNFTVVPMFEERYVQAVQGLRNQARRTRRDDTSNNASPAGSDNPILPNQS